MLLERNYGTTGSVNRALAASDSEFVLLLNNDVELAPEFVQTLRDVLRKNPKLGFAAGKLLSARDLNRLDGAGDALLMAGAAYRLGHGDVDYGYFDEPRRILSACGAATLYRRSALMQAGGLDEAFFAYLDDVDLSLRLHWLGYEGLYEPRAVAYHIGSATLGDPLHPRIVRWLSRNQLLLVFKNFPASVLVRCGLRILWFHLLWMAYCCKKGGFLTYLRALAEVVLLLPRTLRERSRVPRKITTGEFLTLLRASEAQIRDWQGTTEKPSRLLNLYFRLFASKPRVAPHAGRVEGLTDNSSSLQ